MKLWLPLALLAALAGDVPPAEQLRVVLVGEGNRAACVVSKLVINTRLATPGQPTPVMVRCETPVWIHERGQWRKLE